MNNSHPKIHIKYPSLVEQACAWAQEHGYMTDKAGVYRRMIAKGVIDQHGHPTAAAIKRGDVIIDPYHFGGSIPDPVSLDDFKAQHPIYQQFDDSHFVRAGGKWCVDAQSVRVIAVAALESPDTPANLKRRARALLDGMGER